MISPWVSIYTLDPSNIEGQYCLEDSMSYMTSIFSESSEETAAKILQIHELLAKIPPREADFIELYYFKGMKQTQIASIFKVSQPTVSYRLNRGSARIRFQLEMPEVDNLQLERDLTAIIPDLLDVRIMMLLKETSCQSEVAKRLGVSQGLVRHRFLRTLKFLRDHSSMEEHVELFDYLTLHLNLLREVQKDRDEDIITRRLS